MIYKTSSFNYNNQIHQAVLNLKLIFMVQKTEPQLFFLERTSILREYC